jgi:NitT/TauT family transport system substrate-binding protein
MATREGIPMRQIVLTRRTALRAGASLALGSLAVPLVAACSRTTPPTPTVAPTAGATAQAAPPVVGGKQPSVRFNWTIKGEFTPFFIAREKGFYQEQGLAPDLLEGKSGTQAAQVVGVGNDQFGYIPSVQVIQGINQGMPLLGVATCGTNTGMCWASPANVPLSDPKSLEGHKVSISTSSTFFQVWDAFARKFGVDTSKVDVVAADPSARVGLFLAHQIDILADIFVANDYVVLQTKSKDPLNLLKLTDMHFDPVGYVLVANKGTLQNDRPMVKAFSQATLKGLQYTLDYPDEAVQIMTRLYGDQLGADVIQGQVKNLLPLINVSGGLGHSDPAAWDESLALLLDAGVIDKKLGLEAYFTNELIQA